MKLDAKQALGKAAIDRAIEYAAKDPQKNLPRVLKAVETMDRKKLYKRTYENLRKSLGNPDDNWNRLITNALQNVDISILQKMVTNVVLYSGMLGYPVQMAAKEKYQCNIPWAILMDPTSACNLKCTGGGIRIPEQFVL